MKKIIRGFLKKVGYNTRVRVIYADEVCGHPECDRVSYMAFFLTGGIIYSCLEHFKELMSVHGEGLQQMYDEILEQDTDTLAADENESLDYLGMNRK